MKTMTKTPESDNLLEQFEDLLEQFEKMFGQFEQIKKDNL